MISFIFSFLPAEIQVILLGIIAVIAIVVIIKIIGMVLDAIPFL